MIELTLPFPDKVLWPNGRPGHWAVVRRAFKKHKFWAFAEAQAEKVPTTLIPDRIDWSVAVHPKTRNVIDSDNALASLKAYQDGLAQAIGVDDKRFNTPTLTFGDPVKFGSVVIRLHL